MALSLAGRYAHGDRRDDLEQVACLGLVKAARRFDPAQGNFRSYAIPMILGEIKRFWRDSGWALHVPRPVQERLLRIRSLAADVEQRNARPPTAAELAQLIGCREEDVVEALTAEATAAVLSLDGASEQPDGVPLAEQVGGDDPGFEYVECMESIKRALPELTRLEQEVVRLRFQQELTQREIASQLSIPPRRVAALLEGALLQLTARATA